MGRQKRKRELRSIQHEMKKKMGKVWDEIACIHEDMMGKKKRKI